MIVSITYWWNGTLLYYYIVSYFLDPHPVWRYLDPTLDIWSNFVKKRSHLPPFLKEYTTFYNSHLFIVCIIFTFNNLDTFSFHSYHFLYSPSYPSRYPPRYLPNYPPGYPPSYLMLPNLTNQFIKLSDGVLQCEWNWDIFNTNLSCFRNFTVFLNQVFRKLFLDKEKTLWLCKKLW